ncbi:MAG TPA: translation elongation factor Ts [Vicinamibacterales bacterium]|nr:translation elongation factor Ts [Vicinamibacterales bacterium]
MSTNISAELVKKLRDRTGAGMMECKAALQDANGDLEEATTILRKRGLAQAAKKSGRSTSEGLIGSYIHQGGKIGVLVELNCESDFVAKTDDFQTLLKELALQVAAASPEYVRRDDVPADVLERERAIYRAQMQNSGKPPHVIDKIVEGKLGSFYEQAVLLDQPSIRDPKTTVSQMVQAAIAKLGENLGIARFVRFRVGDQPGSSARREPGGQPAGTPTSPGSGPSGNPA